MSNKIVSICEYNNGSIFLYDTDTEKLMEMRLQPHLTVDTSNFGYVTSRDGKKVVSTVPVKIDAESIQIFAKKLLDEIIEGSDSITKEELVRRVIQKKESFI